MKKICLSLLGLGVVYNASALEYTSDRTYVSGMLTAGVYKMNGNESIDGHFPTTFLGGLGVSAGISNELNRNFYFINELGYNFGYRQAPAANYSSLMFRMGTELNVGGNSYVIPFATMGAGVVALDPENAYIQMDFGYEFQAGVKVQWDDDWKIIVGTAFTEAKLDYSEKDDTTTFQRFNGFLGVERTF